MKKILAMAAAMAMFSAAVFADVACKKLDNGKVEVTFSYSHPSAKNVLLAGDFTNWQSGAKTMKKRRRHFCIQKSCFRKKRPYLQVHHKRKLDDRQKRSGNNR